MSKQATELSRQSVHSYIESTLLSGSTVAGDQDLLLSGLLDSLSVMTLVSHLEAQRGMQIPPQDITLENFESVDKICDYLELS
jgi:acyl carrier protein